MPSIFAALLLEDAEAGFHRDHVVLGAPIALERGIEHLAEPVDDDGLAHLREHAVIDAGVILRPACDLGEGAARHEDDAAAKALDGLDLLLVGADHVVDGDVGADGQMVRARARGDDGAGARPGFGQRALDQLQRPCPVEAHAALGGVHRLGDTEAEIPEIVPEGERALPVD